ncbi:MAG: helix-turn-helix domain-containing protein [Planctomycetaceae bacterium]|nr:helix-turn-helix domain-containing protein [Planctomycetaceae bacterium]MBV8608816.1 helix-turn-helix domain-containing protein [Singulisphaera sp.]
MSPSTTRATTPAATPRTGRGVAALPNDPGLDAILADPNLTSTAKALITVMIRNWAWYKDHCWPSDATLAKKVGKSVGHVQRCLRELERAGRIERERTDAVPNGRRIWLLWRCPGGRAGARPEPAPARTAAAAPARSERVVIVNEGRESEIQPASRRRPKIDPVPTAVRDAPPPPASASRAGESSTPPGPPPTARGARETSPAPVTEAIRTAIGRALPGVAAGPLEDPAPAVVPDASHAAPLPLDLGAIGTPMASFSRPPQAPRATPPRPSAPSPPAASAPRSAARRPSLGLDLAELARVVGETADPILAAELARRTAPPPPPEPPPGTLPTAELFELLPGRHDLIAAATQRLAAELGDFKVVSWKFFQQAVQAVVTRSVPPEVLLDCHRQATSPAAKNRGSVFVVAWQREVPQRC